MEYVWPKLRSRCGGARFVIVGAIPAGGAWAPNIRTRQQQERAGVTVAGFQRGDVMTSYEPAATAKVFVSPVLVRSGFNTKNLLALQHHIPLVATAAGSTGLPEGAAVVVDNNKMQDYGAQEGEKFASAAAKLYTDSAYWEGQANRGRNAAMNYFSEAAVQSEFAAAIDAVVAHSLSNPDRKLKPPISESLQSQPPLMIT